MEYLQLACPYCAGQFSAAATTENRTTACPHCDREVTVPAAPPARPPSPAPVPPPIPHAGPPEPRESTNSPPQEAIPPRRLSPAEKARLRRRLNVVVAVVGMAILAIALMVLLRIRP